MPKNWEWELTNLSKFQCLFAPSGSLRFQKKKVRSPKRITSFQSVHFQSIEKEAVGGPAEDGVGHAVGERLCLLQIRGAYPRLFMFMLVTIHLKNPPAATHTVPKVLIVDINYLGAISDPFEAYTVLLNVFGHCRVILSQLVCFPTVLALLVVLIVDEMPWKQWNPAEFGNFGQARKQRSHLHQGPYGD